MTRVRLGLLLMVLIVTGAVPARAQAPQDVWQVSVDFLLLATRGNDIHVGDVFTESQRFIGPLTNSTFNYGTTYEPIVPRMKTDQSVLVAAAYRGPRWGVGVRGWRVATLGGVDGRDSSPAPTSSFDAVTGIRLWDHSLIPVADEQHPSGISPVTFHADNSIENLRIDGYAERRWIAGTDLNVATRFGVAHARVKNVRTEGQTQHAFTVETSGGSTTTLSNDITLHSESRAEMSLTGPLLGIAGDSTFRRVRIDWMASQAFLMGTVETSGTWTDIDDITNTIVTGGSTALTFELLNGEVPMSLEERALVPVLDVQVKASVAITHGVRIGAGLFSSSWFHLPVAPAFSVPGEWTDVAGTGWRDQKRDITFAAVSVFAGFGF